MTDWRVLRAAIKERDRVCTTPGCGRPINFVEHIVHPDDGGSDDPANLRGQCHRCRNQRRRARRSPLAWGRPLAGINRS
jgi:hypothetical protein